MSKANNDTKKIRENYRSIQIEVAFKKRSYRVFLKLYIENYV